MPYASVLDYSHMGIIARIPALYRAILIILFGIFAFDLMGVFVRILGEEFPIFQISALRNIFGVIPALLFVMASGSIAGLRRICTPYQIGLCAFRGLSVIFAQICYYTALSHIAFATATTLAFAGPMFITALSVPVLGHKVGFWRWSAVILGFIGVIVIMRPGADAFEFYAILPVLAAVGYAMASVTVRLFPSDVGSSEIQLVTQIFSLVFSVIILLVFADPLPITGSADWLKFLMVGICGGIGVLCLVTSYRLVEPGQIAPFEYLGIPISFILGYIFFSEAPFDQLIPGVFLIIGAGLIIVWRERHINAKKETGDADAS